LVLDENRYSVSLRLVSAGATLVNMKVPERPGSRLRLVLLIGFGGLLTLLLISGLSALAILQSTHAEEQTARQTFLAKNDCLMTFRSHFDEYGNRVQQVFVASRIESASDLAGLSTQVHATLQSYPAARKPEEQALLTALERTLAEQEQVVNTMLADSRRTDRNTMTRYVSEEVYPLRLRVVAATEQIATWDHQQFSSIDAELLARFADARARLTRLLLVLLASGLLLSMGSIFYIVRQEREVRQRYTELSESRAAQDRLSVLLIDAQEQERRAISRELHDEVGQSLGALLVDVGRLSALLPPENNAVQDLVRSMKALAERSVNSVRNIALLLRPTMLDDLGLVAALEWQAREVSRRSEIEVEIESSGVSDTLSEDYKTCIYRLVQEALNNAARHSGGRHAWVDVRQNAKAITVSIRDDGHGFDPSRSRGLGLLGMEERVRRLGGTLKVESKPGEGTLIIGELPLA
jgi:signal transduction histidine kinase